MKKFIALSLSFLFSFAIYSKQLQLPSWNKKDAESEGFKLVDQVSSRVGESCVLSSDVKGFEFLNNTIKNDFFSSGYLPVTFSQAEALKAKAESFKANLKNKKDDVEEVVRAIYFKQSGESDFDNSKFEKWRDSLDFDIYYVVDSSLLATKAFYALYPLKGHKGSEELVKKYYNDNKNKFVKKTFDVEISLFSDEDSKDQDLKIIMEPATIEFIGSDKKWLVEGVECDDKIVENLCNLSVGDEKISFKTSSGLDCRMRLLNKKVKFEEFDNVKKEIAFLVRYDAVLEHFNEIYNSNLKDCIVESKL